MSLVKQEAAPLTVNEWTMIQQQANILANTGFVPNNYRGRPDEIVACVLYGRELGIGPMQSLQQVDMVQGKPTPSAQLIAALIRRAGHSLVALEVSDQKVTVKGRRADTGDEMGFTFTRAMAQRAGLLGKGSWKTYPEAMMWARCVTQIGRMLFSDVLAPVSYTPEEMGVDDVEAAQQVVGELLLEPSEATPERQNFKGKATPPVPTEFGPEQEPRRSDEMSHSERAWEEIRALFDDEEDARKAAGNGMRVHDWRHPLDSTQRTLLVQWVKTTYADEVSGAGGLVPSNPPPPSAPEVVADADRKESSLPSAGGEGAGQQTEMVGEEVPPPAVKNLDEFRDILFGWGMEEAPDEVSDVDTFAVSWAGEMEGKARDAVGLDGRSKKSLAAALAWIQGQR